MECQHMLAMYHLMSAAASADHARRHPVIQALLLTPETDSGSDRFIGKFAMA
jgi:hypothetical protein